jgi:DNA polymerase III subunit gamma/tau
MQLNLARKWRSQTFDQVIGQDLSVRILKNSLYLNYFFPVYLFSGQRGCGKTTMARIFAAGVNCTALADFQKQPKEHQIPCLTCASCLAMAHGSHPDFIEIDAASHTGVDHVRTLIDAAGLLPVLGSKRIYLIDEAHMLSKAAFNAFLKILEDPPAQTHFILATTDVHKVIDTVRSRSFQLFFRPIAPTALLDHLKYICTQESIAADNDGLQLIVQETGGSARDALNLLEQVRFSGKRVTYQAVQQVFGKPDDQLLLQCLELICTKKPQDLIQLVRTSSLATMPPLQLWRALVEGIQALLAVSCKCESESLAHHKELLKKLARTTSLADITMMLEILYTHELLFIKTTAAQAMLELIMLRLCAATKFSESSMPDTSTLVSASAEIKPSAPAKSHVWQQFLIDLESANDPLVSSIMKQTVAVDWQEKEHVVTASFSKDFSFFNDLLETTEHIWLPLLQKTFGAAAQFKAVFIQHEAKTINNSEPPATLQKTSPPEPAQPSQTASARSEPYKRSEFAGRRSSSGQSSQTPKIMEKKLDVSDTATWKKANALLAMFPGVITVIREETKEPES